MAGTIEQGRDTSCVDSLTPGRLVSGKTLVGQRCYHRLITPKGKLRGGEDEANFGCDLPGFVGRTDDRQLPSMLPVVVQNELLKDPAVSAVRCIANRVDDGAGSISWTLNISIDTTTGNVDLIVSVDAVTTQLLGIS